MARFVLRSFHCRVFTSILAFVILYLLTLLFNSSTKPNYRCCFINQSTVYRNGAQLLEDILTAQLKPIPGRSIFFHETSCRQPFCSNADTFFNFFNLSPETPINLASLTARQACAIESAALHSPNFGVFVLFASPAYKSKDDDSDNVFVKAILSYSNVYLRNVNLWTYSAGTPIYELLSNNKLFQSRYVISHTSDFLRLLSLWHWGGTHSDMDIIMLKSMEELPPNYAAAESSDLVANGIMNFAPTGLGHDIAEKCLRDLSRNFNGEMWENNGPCVITRVLQKLCGTNNTKMMIQNKRCQGFRVFPSSVFYEIHWRDWKQFFEPTYLNQTLRRLQRSYAMHVWNKFSAGHLLRTDTKAAYIKLAEKHCPKVFAASGDYF